MNVFGIGLPEMAVIAAIALLVFGPKRLPELGKTLGRTLKGFQSASQGFEEQFRSALEASPEPASSPAKSPATTSSVVALSSGDAPDASSAAATIDTQAAGGPSAS